MRIRDHVQHGKLDGRRGIRLKDIASSERKRSARLRRGAIRQPTGATAFRLNIDTIDAMMLAVLARKIDLFWNWLAGDLRQIGGSGRHIDR
jgi:hypothetical protein